MSSAHHARVKKVFLEAREQPAAEREAFLADCCEGDEELKQEVQSLLLRLPEAEPGEEWGGSNDVSTAPFFGRIGNPLKVTNYRVLQKIGEGGMGEVYEAEQQKPVRRRVALKVLKGGLAIQEVIARFESERQALAMMNHPNIAQVFEAGMTEQERPYFAMELVHGEPMTDYCDRHRLPNRERLDLFIKACHGVQHAHQKGIIHRDLKPSNILVAVEDGHAVPKIIDFGVAKATAQRLTERTLFTQLGQWIGTPEYMSPEQAEMTGLDVDTRTDVYSLGVLLYELLAGARPFDSKELQRVGLDEVRRRIREDDPTRPSTKVSGLGKNSQLAAQKRQTDVASLVQQLRGDLDWITMKALDKDRTRRYASPSEFAADIQRHLDDEPVVACPPSAMYRLRKFVRRNRLSVLAGGFVAATVLLGFLMTGMALLHVQIEAERANQVAVFLEELIADFNPFINRTAVSTENLLDRAVERLETELAGQNLVQARLMRRIGVGYKDLGLLERAEPLLERSLEIFEAEYGREHLEVATSLNELGWLAWEAGNYPRERQFKEKAVEIQRQILDAEDPRLAYGEMDLAFSFWALGKFDRAKELFTRSLAAQEHALGPDHLDVSRNLFLQGVLFNSSGDYRQAHAVLERALRIRIAAFGPDHVHVGWTVRTLARTQRLQGDYRKALESGRRALDLMEAFLGPEHSDLAFALGTLGSTHKDLGNFVEAQPLLERSLALRESALGPDHVEVGLSLTGLGWFYLAVNDPAKAEPLLTRALVISRRGLPPDHPEIAWRLHSLSYQRRLSDRFEEALSLQREALGILEAARGSDHPSLGGHLANLGVLLRETGDLKGARAQLERALSLRELQLGPQHLRIADDLLELALLYDAMNEGEMAGQHFERAVAMYESAGGVDHPLIVRCLLAQAEHLRRLGNVVEAARLDRRAEGIEARRAEGEVRP